MRDNNNGILPVYNNENSLPGADVIYIITRHMCSKVRTKDIEYIEKDMRKVVINTAENRFEVYEAFDVIEKNIKGINFYKPLKGTIVNFDHVKNMDDEMIVFESGKNIMFGRNTICKTKNAFRSYIRETIKYPINREELLVAEKREKG